MIVITAVGRGRQAVETLQVGADDFLTNPLDLEHYLLTIKRVSRAQGLKDEVFQF